MIEHQEPSTELLQPASAQLFFGFVDSICIYLPVMCAFEPVQFCDFVEYSTIFLGKP